MFQNLLFLTINIYKKLILQLLNYHHLDKIPRVCASLQFAAGVKVEYLTRSRFELFEQLFCSHDRVKSCGSAEEKVVPSAVAPEPKGSTICPQNTRTPLTSQRFLSSACALSHSLHGMRAPAAYAIWLVALKCRCAN